MSLHLGIRRRGKHHPDEVIAALRVQLAGAGDRIGNLERTLADVQAKQAEAEMVVACQAADAEEMALEAIALMDDNEALRRQLAPFLAAGANAAAVTVPEMVRDTSAIEDQATAPIDVRPLWEAHGISPVVRVAETPDTVDPRTPTWVPSPDSESTQTLRVVAA